MPLISGCSVFVTPAFLSVIEDSSFLVHINSSARSIDFGNGLKGGLYSSSANWRAATEEISEDGQFRFDDVRLFDGPSTDGPFHLLSGVFAGCNGFYCAE
jgi:hypothetical protein